MTRYLRIPRLALVCLITLGACTRVTPPEGPAAQPPAPNRADEPLDDELEPVVDDEPLEDDIGIPAADDTVSLAEVEAAIAEDSVPELTEVTPEYMDEILTSSFADTEEIRDRTQFWIDRWTGSGRGYFQRYLNRMGRYSHIVDAEIEARGLPRALRYLPIVESGYNPVAVSRVGATGLWQFMRPTARWLGVRVDGLVDERRDPEVATRYALGYLEDLRDQFNGSWFLALAAYNGGPGTVRRVIRRNGGMDAMGDSLFWALGEDLPNETRHFVPRLFAATELATNAEAYGFTPPSAVDPYEYIEVEVPDATSLETVAKAANADPDEVIALNPHLRQRMTPAGPFPVRIPIGTGENFAERYAAIPEDERIQYVQHRVARGETMSHIAQQYGVSLSLLRSANPGVSPRRMRVGQQLIVPRGGAAAARILAERSSGGGGGNASARPSTSTAPGQTVTHVVSRGESLWTIARRYSVSVDQLRSWNDLSEGQTLYAGTEIAVRGVRVLVYRVQSGDTLSEIAERHGVSTRALAAENGLTVRSVIRPGQEMKIPAGS